MCATNVLALETDGLDWRSDRCGYDEHMHQRAHYCILNAYEHPNAACSKCAIAEALKNKRRREKNGYIVFAAIIKIKIKFAKKHKQV